MRVITRPKPWTRDELKEFIELYPSTDTEVLMKKFGRSQSAILCKAHRLVLSKTTEYNIRRGRETQNMFLNKRPYINKYTKEEIESLRAEYPDGDNAELAIKYGRTARAIIAFAKNRGITKSKEYMSKSARKKSMLAVKARWGFEEQPQS